MTGSNGTVVVKIGGARAVDPDGALADVASLVHVRRDVVVVHGGSTAVDETLEATGREPEYVQTPSGVVGRFTDEETMDAVKMAIAGRINTDLVVGLQNVGVDAVGLSGVDGGLLTGPRKSAVRVQDGDTRKVRRGDHSGRIGSVNVDLLKAHLAGGYTPVVGPPMLADDGVAVNVDADRVAAGVAGVFDGPLVFLTDVEGVYADPDDPSTLVETVDTPEGLEALRSGAEGFMRRKLMAAVEALEDGAEKVVIASANAEEPVHAALAGGGTHIYPGALEGEPGGTPQ